jgi:hypothetical protein
MYWFLVYCTLRYSLRCALDGTLLYVEPLPEELLTVLIDILLTPFYYKLASIMTCLGVIDSITAWPLLEVEDTLSLSRRLCEEDVA